MDTPPFQFPSLQQLSSVPTPKTNNNRVPYRPPATNPGQAAIAGANPIKNLVPPVASSSMLEMDWGNIPDYAKGLTDGEMGLDVAIAPGMEQNFNDIGMGEQAQNQNMMPETAGWGDTLSSVAGIGNTLVGAFGAWNAYNALEETKDQNKYLKKYGTAEFNNAAQVYNQDREDWLYRTEKAKGHMTEDEARAFAAKRMETESVQGI